MYPLQCSGFFMYVAPSVKKNAGDAQSISYTINQQGCVAVFVG